MTLPYLYSFEKNLGAMLPPQARCVAQTLTHASAPTAHLVCFLISCHILFHDTGSSFHVFGFCIGPLANTRNGGSCGAIQCSGESYRALATWQRCWMCSSGQESLSRL